MPEELPWELTRDSISSFVHDSASPIHNAASQLTIVKNAAGDEGLQSLMDELIRQGKAVSKTHDQHRGFRRSEERPKYAKQWLVHYQREIGAHNRAIYDITRRAKAFREGHKASLGKDAMRPLDISISELERYRQQFPAAQLGKQVIARMRPDDLHSFLSRFTQRDFVDRDGSPVKVIFRGKNVGQVNYDPDLMLRSVYNLVTDAYNHTPGRPIYVTMAQRDGHVEVNVTNEGPSLKPEEIAKIGYKRFTRAMHDPKRGYGKISTRLLTEAQGGTFAARNSKIGPMLSIRIPHEPKVAHHRR